MNSRSIRASLRNGGRGRHAVLAIAAVSMLAVATACGGTSGNASTGKSSVGSITVGYSPQAVFMPLFVAVKRGFLQQQGINAKLQSYPSGAEQLDAVLTGQSDVTGNGQFNVPSVAAQGAKIKMIGEYATSGKQFGVVATADVKSPQDLLGKAVGTQLGTSTDYYYHLFTKKYGLDESKIKLKDIKYPELIPALKNHDISAMFAFEPFLTAATQTVPGAHVLQRSGQDDTFLLHVFLGVSPKIYNNARLAEAFLRGMNEADKWLTANPDQAAQLYWSNMGVKNADTAKAQLQLLDFKVDFNDQAMTSLTDVSQYMVAKQLVKSTPNLTNFVDRNYVQTALGSSG